MGQWSKHEGLGALARVLSASSRLLAYLPEIGSQMPVPHCLVPPALPGLLHTTLALELLPPPAHQRSLSANIGKGRGRGTCASWHLGVGQGGGLIHPGWQGHSTSG